MRIGLSLLNELHQARRFSDLIGRTEFFRSLKYSPRANESRAGLVQIQLFQPYECVTQKMRGE